MKFTRNKFENDVKFFSLILLLSFTCPMTANALPFQLKYGMQPSEINYKKKEKPAYYNASGYDTSGYEKPCNLQPYSSTDLDRMDFFFSNQGLTHPDHKDLKKFLSHLRGTTVKELKNKSKAKYQENFIKFLKEEKENFYRDHVKMNPKFDYLINVVEKLFGTDEFKAFLEFQLPDDNEIIVYDIDGDLVCTQFLDNELVQVSLNGYGFKDKLLEIFNVIKEKYEIQTTTYKLYRPTTYMLRGRPHHTDFVIKGSADTQDIGNVEISYPDPNIKKGFFQSAPPLLTSGIMKSSPYITYSEPLMIKQYNDRIQESWIYYEKNILAPMVDRIDKLSIEEKKAKDPYLDQF